MCLLPLFCSPIHSSMLLSGTAVARAKQALHTAFYLGQHSWLVSWEKSRVEQSGSFIFHGSIGFDIEDQTLPSLMAKYVIFQRRAKSCQ